MELKLLLRGALAGGIGGVCAFVFARIFAEPQIQQAIDYEEGRGAAQDALDKAAGLPVPAAEAETFTRTIQANVGIGVGLIAFGIAMGLLATVIYTICLGRVGMVRPRVLALLVAGGAFVGLFLVPWLKYPANPPAVGNDDTIGTRGGLYLVMVLASLVFLGGAVWLGQRLAARFGNWNAALLAGAAYVVAVGVVMLLLPPLGHLAANVAATGSERATETPLPLRDPSGRIVYEGFPADVLATFRLYSVGAQLILWTAFGLVFGPLAERVLVARPAPAATTAVPA
ncbi:CbtA family protein [Cryptosporangium phraense]|uniref:CbtA family protein n=1 Tax=Cryptosporangium phraense TaxID=2593070 RepID=A0A545AQG6_9ACTN|nr:CbtA family protein [Cryptosporangium phraense]TQS42965.1 CbtA family protein [Cryptosporangium phraense]